MFCRSLAISLWGLLLFFTASPALAEKAAVFLPLPTAAPLPSLVLRDGKGGQTLLNDLLREKNLGFRSVILHLWAPNCLPCVPEMQALDAAWPALQASGVEVIALAQDPDGTVTVPAFARRLEIRHLPLYVDTERRALKGLQSRFLPVSYLLDGEGKAAALHEGPLDWASFARAPLADTP